MLARPAGLPRGRAAPPAAAGLLTGYAAPCSRDLPHVGGQRRPQGTCHTWARSAVLEGPAARRRAAPSSRDQPHVGAQRRPRGTCHTWAGNAVLEGPAARGRAAPSSRDQPHVGVQRRPQGPRSGARGSGPAPRGASAASGGGGAGQGPRTRSGRRGPQAGVSTTPVGAARDAGARSAERRSSGGGHHKARAGVCGAAERGGRAGRCDAAPPRPRQQQGRRRAGEFWSLSLPPSALLLSFLQSAISCYRPCPAARPAAASSGDRSL